MSGDSMYGPDPNFSGELNFRVQQAGSAWSVAIYIDAHEQAGSRRSFATEAEARQYGERCISERYQS